MTVLQFCAGLLAVFAVGQVSALQSYQANIPNGANVLRDGESWPWVGHELTPPARSNINQFGKDLQAANYVWTKELCMKDSDQDGFSNGRELGDPNCTWQKNDPQPDGLIGHPGVFEDFSGFPGFDDNFTGTPPPGITLSLDRAVVAHGVLMVMAWAVFAPTGMLLPLLFKTRLKPPIGWFRFHKLFLVTTVYLCLISYIIIVNFKGGFTAVNTHEKVGSTVIVLTIIQPLGGAFRAHVNADGSKSQTRIVWEYVHQNLGRLTMILAIVAIYLGLILAGQQVNKEDQTKGAAVFFVVAFAFGAAACIVYVLGFRQDERLKKEPKLDKEKGPQSTSEGQPLTKSDNETQVVLT